MAEGVAEQRAPQFDLNDLKRGGIAFMKKS
jgi:hypothetical protein